MGILNIFNKYEKEFEPIKWEEIEVGEVFGAKGCFNVGYKINNNIFKVLAMDNITMGTLVTGDNYILTLSSWFYHEGLVKLPKHVQEYWREE